MRMRDVYNQNSARLTLWITLLFSGFCYEYLTDMTSILDIGEGGINPQVEVKRLQDLVKKLENQNEVLRQKSHLTTDDNETNIETESSTGVLKPALNNSVFYNSRKHSEKRDIANISDSLEDVELIDIEACIGDDEDSW